MNNEAASLLITLALFTGFVGDAVLQILTKSLGGPTGWGLKDYFTQHGSAEAMCIAAGMMAIFYALYLFILRLPVEWYYIAVYAVIIDLIFRKTMIFESLKGYYTQLGYVESAIWAIIPMLIPLALFYIIKKN